MFSFYTLTRALLKNSAVFVKGYKLTNRKNAKNETRELLRESKHDHIY